MPTLQEQINRIKRDRAEADNRSIIAIRDAQEQAAYARRKAFEALAIIKEIRGDTPSKLTAAIDALKGDVADLRRQIGIERPESPTINTRLWAIAERLDTLLDADPTDALKRDVRQLFTRIHRLQTQAALKHDVPGVF